MIGLGGKIEPGEDPVSSAVRESKKESGLVQEDPMLRGTFVWIDEVNCGMPASLLEPNTRDGCQSPKRANFGGTASKTCLR
ncbi:MAG: NUDIX domain-containing protein [SAR202 cluster bacterium]|nr:NUDIX domain-containing protein [SAR202 cluster bacterium]